MRSLVVISGILAILLTTLLISGCSGPQPATPPATTPRAVPTPTAAAAPKAVPTPTAAATPKASPTPTAAAAPKAVPTPVAATAGEGKAIYARACAACHGASGEGTTLAPRLAGHSVTAVKLTVRNPLGKMPAIPPSQMSDAEVDKVASFIASLGPVQARVVEWEKTAPETMHHWMALLAIKSNDTPDARHHLQDALAFVKDPKHKPLMDKALDLMAKGNIHDAEHEIEEMAGSESPSGVTRQRLHLTLTMQAIEAKVAPEAKHHLEHFMQRATPKQKPMVTKALELLARNDFHEAEHEVEELVKG